MIVLEVKHKTGDAANTVYYRSIPLATMVAKELRKFIHAKIKSIIKINIFNAI